MSRDPAARPASAEVFGDRLKALADQRGQHPVARTARNWSAPLVILVAILVFLVVAAVVWWLR